jgi:hypothetical protein
MRQVVSGVWQMDEPDANGRVKAVLFVVNISDLPAQAEIRLFPQEYGVRCPEHLSLTMEPVSVKIIEYGV